MSPLHTPSTFAFTDDGLAFAVCPANFPASVGVTDTSARASFGAVCAEAARQPDTRMLHKYFQMLFIIGFRSQLLQPHLGRPGQRRQRGSFTSFASLLRALAQQQWRWRVAAPEWPEIAQEETRFCGGRDTKVPVPGRSPAPKRTGKGQSSVGWRVLVVRSGGDVGTGFVGVGPCGARRGLAGWRVVPGTEMAKDLLDHARVVNHRNDAHGVLAHGAAQRVYTPDPRNQVAGGGMGMRGGVVCNTNEIRPHDSAFCMLPSDLPLGGARLFVLQDLNSSAE